MKKRGGGVGDVGGGLGCVLEFKKKQRFGGKGLSLEVFVDVKKLKFVVIVF